MLSSTITTTSAVNDSLLWLFDVTFSVKASNVHTLTSHQFGEHHNVIWQAKVGQHIADWFGWIKAKRNESAGLSKCWTHFRFPWINRWNWTESSVTESNSFKICTRKFKFSKKRSYINIELFKNKRQKTWNMTFCKGRFTSNMVDHYYGWAWLISELLLSLKIRVYRLCENKNEKNCWT